MPAADRNQAGALSAIRPLAAFARRSGRRLIRSFQAPPVECNVCGWRGDSFESDNWHPRTICPRCQSQVRHRLLAAALAHIRELSYASLVKDRDVLHFAPEPGLQVLIQRHAARYVAADAPGSDREGLDLNLDISNMPAVQAGQFDLLIACDVLEHVPDHLAAMRELHRVLRSAGWAILTVPQKDDLAVTFEDPSVTSPAERERVFGQSDHVRIYGDDFSGLLAQAGFQVTPVEAGRFPPRLVKKHVLSPPILSSQPLATNRRKIFFARKR